MAGYPGEQGQGWCRWRLSRGIAAGTVHRDLRACTSLARHLPASAGPGGLTREQLEGWLAALSAQRPHPSRAGMIISVGTFLRDARRNEWEPALPPGALIYHGDTPPKAPRNPRWIPEFLMRQLETPEALARFPSDFGRVLVQILIACGLRLKDADLPDGHPLASAQWLHLSMVRAKVTLPNGYCGAPVQTDCEYASPCLDCRFFITTPDFLAQHRQQREDTRQMIARAEDGGLARVAEKNTRTLGRLDKIITALEQAGAGEVVSGGGVTGLDAVG